MWYEQVVTIVEGMLDELINNPPDKYQHKQVENQRKKWKYAKALWNPTIPELRSVAVDEESRKRINHKIILLGYIYDDSPQAAESSHI